MKRLQGLVLAVLLFLGGMVFAPQAMASCTFDIYIDGVKETTLNYEGGDLKHSREIDVDPGSTVTAVGSCIVGSDGADGRWECVEENTIRGDDELQIFPQDVRENFTATCFFPEENTDYFLKINDGTQDAIRVNINTKNVSDEEEDRIRNKLSSFNFCGQINTNSELYAECVSCVSEGNTIYTAVGCIRTDGVGLAEDLIALLLGISGGVALLSLLAGSYYFTTSQGDTNKVKTGKELMTAAVSGLLFIIFSVIILQFVGITILRIPGLG